MNTKLPADLVQALTSLGFTHDFGKKSAEALRSVRFTVSHQDSNIRVQAFPRSGDWWSCQFDSATPVAVIVQFLSTCEAG